MLHTYWLNLGWVLMSWVSHRLRDQDNCCIHLSGHDFLLHFFLFLYSSSSMTLCSIAFSLCCRLKPKKNEENAIHKWWLNGGQRRIKKKEKDNHHKTTISFSLFTFSLIDSFLLNKEMKLNTNCLITNSQQKEPGVAFHFLFFPTFISIDY